MPQRDETLFPKQKRVPLDINLMFPQAMRPFFMSTFEQLQKMNSQPFLQARTHYAEMQPFQSIVDVLMYLRNDRTPETYRDREALIVCLITEYHRVPSAFWSHGLIMVFAPMLARLRGRLGSLPHAQEDIDHALVEIFLSVIFEYDLEKLHQHAIIAIRRACTYKIFQHFRLELEEQRAQQHLSDCVKRFQFNPFDEVNDDVDLRDVMMAEFSRTIKRHLKNKQYAELITQTLIQGQSLRSYVHNMLQHQTINETPDVFYQVIKRRRSREIAHLRLKLAKRIKRIREHQNCADE